MLLYNNAMESSEIGKYCKLLILLMVSALVILVNMAFIVREMCHMLGTNKIADNQLDLLIARVDTYQLNQTQMPSEDISPVKDLSLLVSSFSLFINEPWIYCHCNCASSLICNYDNCDRKISIWVILGFTVSREFFNYRDGVYSGCSDASYGGHAIAIVGYGKDSLSGKDYWIIKNSWGTK